MGGGRRARVASVMMNMNLCVGYRAFYPPRLCLRSIFALHNETVRVPVCVCVRDAAGRAQYS